MSGNATSKITLTSSTITCTLDAAHGARLSSLIVNSHELLVQADTEIKTTHPMSWGAYPMVPWAGRVRNGVFAHHGITYHLRCNKEPHAIHGTVFDTAWAITESSATSATMTTDLGEHWPLGGSAEHRVSLRKNILECQLGVTAGKLSMPVQVGWHPWFVRPVTLTSVFAKMFVRDEAGIPTGRTITPIAPPWDDCFTAARTSPLLNFANGVTITIESNCEYWVVYDEPDHAICVEPQSGPPDGFTLMPLVIEPHQTFTRQMRLIIS